MSFRSIRRALLMLPAVCLALCPGDVRAALEHDDGKMDQQLAVEASGATVEFLAETPGKLVSVQFYGARYGAAASATDSFKVSVYDSAGSLLRTFEKPLFNVSPSRAVWQTVAIAPPVDVSGKFSVTLSIASDADRGLYLGLDSGQPRGFSRKGAPGQGPAGMSPSGNWMVRARVVDPSKIAARAAVTVPKPKPAPTTTAPAVRPPANRKPMAAVTPAPRSGRGAALAYRDPHRRLSFVNTPPRIPRGSGRVDVRWNVEPVTVELNYVGKPPKILENLNVKRLAVDFPVPEPGLFNVVVRKPGYRSVSKQFRVVSGGRHEWSAVLEPGEDAPVPAVAPAEGAGTVPKVEIEEVPPAIGPQPEVRPLNDAQPRATGIARPESPSPGGVRPDRPVTPGDRPRVNRRPPEMGAPGAPPAPADGNRNGAAARDRGRGARPPANGRTGGLDPAPPAPPAPATPDADEPVEDATETY